MKVITLDSAQIEHIHRLLSIEAENSGDPIKPPGIRNRNLLESSTSVQNTSMYDEFKYTCPIHNAMALTYSLTTNHAFNNGNKRTALVSMLAHLDANSFVLKPEVTETHLFCLFISCASHRLDEFSACKRADDFQALKRKIESSKNSNREFTPKLKNMDKEIRLMWEWGLKNARTFSTDEKKINFKQLKEILVRFSYNATYDGRRKRLNVVKREGLLSLLAPTASLNINLNINEEAKMSKKDIATIREWLQLTDQYGIDSRAFYEGTGIVVDPFISKYRKVLTELAAY